MSIISKTKHIAAELRGHAPFTIFGAVIGLAFMLIFRNIGKPYASVLFGIFHPSHVVLSAMVTASMFAIHRKVKHFVFILIIGYFGSVGIATLSDCVIPYFGERLLGLHIPKHAEMHDDDKVHDADAGHEHANDHHRIHLGFIEEWYIVNPAAILGVLIACFLPRTKLPHAGHVLISTWASSSYILMNTAGKITIGETAGVFGVLFIAVWLPCCISDIVFPLLFVKSDLKLVETCVCTNHAHHSHAHKHEHSDKCADGQGE